MSTARKLLSATLALSAALTLSAAPASASGLSLAQAAKQYRADAVTVNNAWAHFSSAFTAWDAPATVEPSKTQSFVTPLVKAFGTFEHKLLTQRWPATARSDIHALGAAAAALQGDIAGLPSVNVLSVSSWLTTTQRDEANLSYAAGVVKSDLRMNG